MPFEITAWACKWGCGREPSLSAVDTASHEGNCYWNPARRCCESCERGRDGKWKDCDAESGYTLMGPETNCRHYKPKSEEIKDATQ